MDDFDAVFPPAEADAADDDRFRSHAPPDPEQDVDWRSDFRSYLDDPA